MSQANLGYEREDIKSRDVVATRHVIGNVTLAALTGSTTAISNALTIPEVTTAPSVAPDPAPAAGNRVLVWCAADSKLYLYNGSAWIKSAALA